MDNIANGPGATMLTIAIAAGWVAFVALILRIVFMGIKSLIIRFKG